MHRGGDEQSAPSPAVDVVQLLVAMAWAEEQGEDIVLRGEEEDDGELGEGEKSCRVRLRVQGQGCRQERREREASVTSAIRIRDQFRILR